MRHVAARQWVTHAAATTAATGAPPQQPPLGHRNNSRHVARLEERDELDVLGRERAVAEWRAQRVQVVCADCNERAAPREVVVELVLRARIRGVVA